MSWQVCRDNIFALPIARRLWHNSSSMDGGDVQPRDINIESDVVLRSPPNWMAVILFGVLCCLHYTMASAAFLHWRWEGYLSAILGTMFLGLAIISKKANVEIRLIPAKKIVSIRSGVGKFRSDREIPFTDVRSVRLTICGTKKHRESILQIICALEEIDCPPTDIPRQQALWLAMTMNVPLMKVSDEESAFTPQRLESINY